MHDLERRVVAAVAQGQVERARRLRRQLLRSFDARLLAVNYGARKTRTLMTLAQLEHAAHHLNAWRGSRDIAVTGRPPKSDGTFRTHYSFGLEHRALQYLARMAMLPASPGSDWNYMSARRGKDLCIRQIVADMTRNKYWVLADIKGAYDSVREAGATRLLPLPGEVAHNVIFGGQLGVGNSPTRRRRSRHAMSARRWSMSGSHASRDGAGGLRDNPPGLIQGSACSDAAMGWLMVPVAEAVGCDIRVYGDDMIIPARTLRDARASEDTLDSALKAHPAGELNAKYMRVVRREDGFAFLGYHLRRLPQPGNKTVARRPRRAQLAGLSDDCQRVIEELGVEVREHRSAAPKVRRRDWA